MSSRGLRPPPVGTVGSLRPSFGNTLGASSAYCGGQTDKGCLEHYAHAATDAAVVGNVSVFATIHHVPGKLICIGTTNNYVFHFIINISTRRMG